jgi:hypothetical protein
MANVWAQAAVNMRTTGLDLLQTAVGTAPCAEFLQLLALKDAGPPAAWDDFADFLAEPGTSEPPQKRRRLDPVPETVSSVVGTTISIPESADTTPEDREQGNLSGLLNLAAVLSEIPTGAVNPHAHPLLPGSSEEDSQDPEPLRPPRSASAPAQSTSTIDAAQLRDALQEAQVTPAPRRSSPRQADPPPVVAPNLLDDEGYFLPGLDPYTYVPLTSVNDRFTDGVPPHLQPYRRSFSKNLQYYHCIVRHPVSKMRCGGVGPPYFRSSHVGTVQGHIREAHLGGIRLRCPFGCTATFGTRSGALNHIRGTHPGKDVPKGYCYKTTVAPTVTEPDTESTDDE